MLDPVQTPDTSLSVFLPFEKLEKQANGTLLVTSVLNDETVDDQGEIMDYDGTKDALDEYMKWANVREMHQESAVGTVQSITHDDVLRKSTAILEVVDPTAILKVEQKVYKGTSLGGWKRGRVLQKVGGKQVARITKPIVIEASLVDRPSRPTARLSLMKVAGIEEPPMDETVEVPPFEAEEPVTELEKVATTADPAEPEAGTSAASGDAGTEDPEELAKRSISQAERDKMPAADFAGKDKSFPISQPVDVAAAAASVGRAGEGNYSSDTLKRRIIAIAKRKGEAFVARLPKAWRADYAKLAETGDLAKGSDPVWDASSGLTALGIINQLLDCEFEEGEADDVGFLKTAQAAMLAYVESESKEIGTETETDAGGSDGDDAPVAMAYAAVIGDLAKRAATRDFADPSIQAIGALLGSVTTPPDPVASSAPTPPESEGEPLEKVAATEDTLMQKIAAAVQTQLGSLVSPTALSAIETRLATMGETLAKVAAVPAPGGPLRYAVDDRRFEDLAELMGKSAGRPTDAGVEAEVLTRLAAESNDPVVGEALRKMAAANLIKREQTGS